MACGSMNGTVNPNNVQSWNDLALVQPLQICELIAYAELNSVVGTLVNSTNFATPASTWSANTATINSAPICAALGTDNQQKVADATQWNFDHLTKSGNANIAPPLAKMVFLRAGNEWIMEIPLAFGGTTYDNIQLSFRNNAATRGDSQGTIPVIQFSGTFTGTRSLKVVLTRPGFFQVGLRLIDGSNNYYFFDMEWIAVP